MKGFGLKGVALSLLFAAAPLCVPLGLADPPAAFEPEIRDLALQMTVPTMPTAGYYSFACGSNGGPPLRRLSGWAQFKLCTPEANGLREVYVEFDSKGQAESDLFKELYGEALWIDKYSGTKVAGYPVILSVLFDDAGVVRGIRAVTDSRAGEDNRAKAYLLRNRVLPHYGSEGWTCEDKQPSGGETPVGTVFIKQHCEKEYEGNRTVVVETHFFRKAGQTGLDAQGQFAAGQFESSTRWEVWDLSVNRQ